AMGINEAAARKRVSRGVRKLREVFVNRGVIAPAVAGLTLLLARAAGAAPSASFAQAVAPTACRVGPPHAPALPTVPHPPARRAAPATPPPPARPPTTSRPSTASRASAPTSTPATPPPPRGPPPDPPSPSATTPTTTTPPTPTPATPAWAVVVAAAPREI